MSQEIVALNGLQSPYVDEEGFSMPLLVNGSGNQGGMLVDIYLLVTAPAMFSSLLDESNNPIKTSVGYLLITACCQAMWETVEGYIVVDRREAIVDEYTDKDKSLDKIIRPYRGM